MPRISNKFSIFTSEMFNGGGGGGGGVRRSNCKQIWLRVHDPSEGMLKLLLYKILLV